MPYTIENTNFWPQIIPDVSPTQDGVVPHGWYAALASLVAGTVPLGMYSDNGVGAPVRPAANAVGAVPGVTAVQIWNVSNHAPQFSDGVNWYDADGNLT